VIVEVVTMRLTPSSATTPRRALSVKETSLSTALDAVCSTSPD
jgi:hypothetical protein